MKKAFTLAEVLITLTIIGVIAVLTIPTLMRKYNDYATVVAVKEAQALLATATKKAMVEYGPMDEWWDTSLNPYGNVLAHRQYASKIFSQLKTTKNCNLANDGSNVTKECPSYIDTYYGAARAYKSLNGERVGFRSQQSNGGMWAPAVLQNGMFIWIVNVKNYQGVRFSKRTYAAVTVDIDGYRKGPNTFGLDTFGFFIQDDGTLMPYGIYDVENFSGIPYAKACSKTSERGLFCTVWVIMKGNMDYKYKDVDLTPFKQAWPK